jgi:hypothetical protein
MPASENNLKLKNIFPSFFFKFRKGIVFSTFWGQKSISEKLFSKHNKWTAAVLNINSASKILEKKSFFIIKMASEIVHIKLLGDSQNLLNLSVIGGAKISMLKVEFKGFLMSFKSSCLL